MDKQNAIREALLRIEDEKDRIVAQLYDLTEDQKLEMLADVVALLSMIKKGLQYLFLIKSSFRQLNVLANVAANHGYVLKECFLDKGTLNATTISTQVVVVMEKVHGQ